MNIGKNSQNTYLNNAIAYLVILTLGSTFTQDAMRQMALFWSAV